MKDVQNPDRHKEITAAPAALTRGTLAAIEDYISKWFPDIEHMGKKVSAEAQKIYDAWLGREHEQARQASEARAAEEARQKADQARHHPWAKEQVERIKREVALKWHEVDVRTALKQKRDLDPDPERRWSTEEAASPELDAVKAQLAAQRAAADLMYQRQKKALDQAFARYQAAANKTNLFYKYVNDNMAEGFSPDEWSILTAGITFRGMPTSGDLMYKDVILRNAGIHSANLARNFEEEIGTGRKGEDPSHAQLLFDSLRVMQRHLPGRTGTPGEIPFVDDVCTHAMIEQLLLFRKEGIHFNKIAEAPKSWLDFWHEISGFEGWRPQSIQQPREEFDRLCSERGIVLPHAIRSASAYRHPEKKLNAINMLEGTTSRKQGSDDGPEARARMSWRPSSWIPFSALHGGPGLPNLDPSDPSIANWDDWHKGTKEFILAQHIVGLLPNEAFLDYGIGTRKNQRADPTHPYDGQFALTQAFDLLAREANAKGHVDAYLKLVQNYAGYIPSPDDRKRALKWGVIHVGENKKGVEIGVEQDHAALSLDMVLSLAQAHSPEHHFSMFDNAHKINNIVAITNALNFVVDHGYFKLQHDHMQHIVEALTAARKKAKAEGIAFVMPKPVEPEKMSWVDTLCEVSNGVRRTGRGLTQ